MHTIHKSILGLFILVILASTSVYSQSISINDVSINEGNSGQTNMQFTITWQWLSFSSRSTTVAWTTTTNGSATQGDDFDAANGTVSFSGRIPRTTTINVPINGDTDPESDETVEVTISIQSGSGSISDGSGTGTIQNDDFPPLQIGISDAQVTEGDLISSQNATIYVSLDQAPPQGHVIELSYHTTDGSATFSLPLADYVRIPLLAVLPDPTIQLDANNYQNVPVNVTVWGDNRVESDEDLFVEFSLVSGNATFANSDSGRIAIWDNDQADVSVTKAVFNMDDTPHVGPVITGESYKYKGVLKNNGPKNILQPIVVTDQLPAGITVIADSITDNGVYDANTHSISWVLPFASEFTYGSTWTAGFAFTVDADLPEDLVLTNMACYALQQPLTRETGHNLDMDPDPDNDCAEHDVMVKRPPVDFCCNFDSDKNVGLPPVITNFNHLKPKVAYNWNLDIDVHSPLRNPSYAYWSNELAPGKLTSPYEGDCGFEGFVTVYEPGGLGHLQVVSASPSLKDYAWDNAVDGDTYWHNGTALVTGDEPGGTPWAIFEFTDQGTRTLEKIRLMNDTGICHDTTDQQQNVDPFCSNRFVQAFQVFASETGMDDGDWTMILDATKEYSETTPCDLGDDWMEWEVPTTAAKYIKLVITDPSTAQDAWVQLGEFEAWFKATLADVDQSMITCEGEDLMADGVDEATITLTLKDADGNPIEGLTEHDIKLFSRQVNGQKNVENECTDTDIFSGLTETAPGVYQVMLTSTSAGMKTILVSVNGVVLSKPNACGFGTQGQVAEGTGSDCADPSQLIFVSGTDTYAKGYMEYGWENAVDGDLDGWDGTVRARGLGDSRGPAYGIFRFCDNEAWKFDYVRIQTENGQGAQDQATQFQIWVSSTTTDADQFTKVADIRRRGNGEERWYSLPETEAKYVKLIMTQPVNRYPGNWRQLVEFSVDSHMKTGPWKGDGRNAAAVPGQFALMQNYPNPFNPVTTLSFDLPKDSHVSLDVFDIQGKQVARLVDDYRAAGSYSVQWDASHQPSGVYFYRLTAGSEQAMKRMVLMK